ncbi:hypothetical protein Acr_18g0008270 [Actinidia rufa]|uniref:Uncharacterized protein n=1 Tax=Actinidia rufa TaxID=165716 RepID=A0A7J0G7A4_9ERIC|nr:hypothetical protein Acr_18g0008270 [Actinidia rufa]
MVPPAMRTIATATPYKVPSSSSLVSARKLAANLWELHQYRLPLSIMHHGGNGLPPRLRRLHHHHHHHHQVPDPSPSSPDLVKSPIIPSEIRNWGCIYE